MIKRIILAIGIMLMGFCYSDEVFANPQSTITDSNLWTSRLIEPDQVLMNSREIKLFNYNIIEKANGEVVNLAYYPRSCGRSKLLDKIYQCAKLSINNGQKLPDATNISGIKADNRVKYGFIVRKTGMYSLPDLDPNRKEAVIGAAEPVVILHSSADSSWFFVQTYNYIGWVSAVNVATTVNRNEWLSKLSSQYFLMVKGPKLCLTVNNNSQEEVYEFFMGTKLPLLTGSMVPLTVDGQSSKGKYAVVIPVRDKEGKLDFVQALVNIDQDVCIGYLPYTRANIIRQVLKFQTQETGDLLTGTENCSPLLANVFRSFGLELPRTIKGQEAIPGKTTDLTKLKGQERSYILKALQPGGLLFFPGQAMIYLGNIEGRHYVVAETRNRNGVLVGDLANQGYGNTNWLQAVTVAKQYEQTKGYFDFINLAELEPTIKLDIRYATSNNFTGEPVYSSAKCLLRKEVAEKLVKVHKSLQNQGLGLVIYDGYRPLSVQREFWEIVSDSRFIANPERGSKHNRGAAVDVGLVDKYGKILPMPSEFDEFSFRASRSYMKAPQAALNNRNILERAMVSQGFIPYSGEWWHFDAPEWFFYPLTDRPL